jgi:hypothetical protein
VRAKKADGGKAFAGPFGLDRERIRGGVLAWYATWSGRGGGGGVGWGVRRAVGTGPAGGRNWSWWR